MEKPKRKKAKKEKSAPKEMSSSRPGGAPSFLRVQEPKIMDPRFQGEYDPIEFERNYAFLQRNRKHEIDQIAAEDGDEFSEERKRRLQSLRDQYKTHEQKLKTIQESMEWHREEKARIAEGKRPFWLNKKAMEDMKQRKQFEELKQNGGLQKYLQKRRKKQAEKDKRNRPF